MNAQRSRIMSKTAWIAGTAALALTAALAGTAAQAQQWRGHGYGYVAPSPYVQQVPPARVWVPGHWEWNGYRNIWISGYYEERPVYVQPYVQPYVQHYGHPSIARRDQDRDGIPDRYDRDRDGDGVPNRYDRQPANPWRR
jgi:hypothetical protein